MTTPNRTTKTRFDRFQNEVAAGGSVTEPDAEQPLNGWQGILGALGIVGLFALLAVVNMWMFVFAVGVLISVFLHELGHFVTARLTGMKATQFFIGFGPRVWSFRRGETEYGVRALPLGAFVRIVGMNNLDEEVPPEDEARTYRQKTFPRRLLVISAGSLMHLLIAVVLLFGVYSTRGELTEQPGAEVVALQRGGPAAEAGIEPGDVVLSVDGVQVEGADDIGDVVRRNDPTDVVDVVVRRGGGDVTIPVGLGANTDEQSEQFGAALLGVSTRGAAEWQEMPIGEAATNAVTDLVPVSWESTKGIVKVLNPVNIWNHLSGESDDLATRPTTLVGVTQVSGAIGETEGIVGVIYLLAVLNVFVGVFNMFPLLPLDGGHAAVAVYERFRERNGRRYFADVSRLMPYAMGVITVLAVLLFSGLYLDVTRPLG